MRRLIRHFLASYIDSEIPTSSSVPAATSDAGEPLGISTISLDYPVNPRCRVSEHSPGGRAITYLIDQTRPRQLQYIRKIGALTDRLAAIPLRSDGSDKAAWINDMLPGLDAAFLYAMTALHKPRRYIEIGSGTSTKFVRQAIRDYGLETKIVSIDPEPRADIDDLCDEVIRSPFEDVPMSFFESMSRDDVFFLDGSHRCLQNSDVTVFFGEIIPALPAGCLYGIHDIFLPQDYPQAWARRFYSEQYVLGAYLLGGAGGDTVEFPAWHLCTQPDSWAAINEVFKWDASGEVERHGGAFWMRRNSG